MTHLKCVQQTLFSRSTVDFFTIAHDYSHDTVFSIESAQQDVVAHKHDHAIAIPFVFHFDFMLKMNGS